MTNDSNRIVCADLTDGEQATLDALVEVWADRLNRNAIRTAYYDSKNYTQKLGISLPPQMNVLNTVLGWSAKSVDLLNRRCKLEGFRPLDATGPDLTSIGLDQIWSDNRLALEAPQAQISSLIHAVSFLVVSIGDTTIGEPPVLINAKDASTSSALWDQRQRRVSAFMSIDAVDESGRPTLVVLFLPNMTVTLRRDLGRWVAERQAHPYGVPVEPLVYQPRLGREFGSSRITRPVMAIQDMAVRTILRSEVSAELYSVPQRVVLGASEAAFTGATGERKSMWEAVLGRVWGIGRDEDGELPELKEFNAAPQTPHMEQLRALAQLFAGETSIPLASLGISGDANPTSSAAYEAGRADLVAEAEGAIDVWSVAWKSVMLRALQMLNGWGEIPADVQTGLQPQWRNPAFESRASAADAAAKEIAVFPWMANSRVGLELFGHDKDFIDRASSEMRKAQAQDRYAEIMNTARQRGGDGVASTSGDVQSGASAAGGSGAGGSAVDPAGDRPVGRGGGA